MKKSSIFFFCFLFYGNTLELSSNELEDIIINLRDEVKTIKKELETKEEYIADLRYKIIKNYNNIQITSFEKSFGGCWS